MKDFTEYYKFHLLMGLVNLCIILSLALLTCMVKYWIWPAVKAWYKDRRWKAKGKEKLMDEQWLKDPTNWWKVNPDNRPPQKTKPPMDMHQQRYHAWESMNQEAADREGTGIPVWLASRHERVSVNGKILHVFELVNTYTGAKGYRIDSVDDVIIPDHEPVPKAPDSISPANDIRNWLSGSYSWDRSEHGRTMFNILKAKLGYR